MLRSILSIAACIVVWGVGWVGANLVLAQALPSRFDANGMTTDPALLVVFIGICAVLCLLVGRLCVQLVKSSPMKHVLVLGLIQLGIGIAVQASVWELMPVWYHLTFLATVVPMHLVGGAIGTARRAAQGFIPRAVEVQA